jgi:hypothetical protein
MVSVRDEEMRKWHWLTGDDRRNLNSGREPSHSDVLLTTVSTVNGLVLRPCPRSDKQATSCLNGRKATACKLILEKKIFYYIIKYLNNISGLC